MAGKREQNGDRSTVTLVDKEGNETTASNPATINSLVYGQGYRIVGDQTVTEAAQQLADAPDAPTQLNPGPIDPIGGDQG
jgi:hypothetical protein